MIRKPRSLRAAYPIGLALAAVIGSSGPASAEHGFKDCAILDHSHASPFVQSRTQLSMLNLISAAAGANGKSCNLIEFRTAEMAQLPTVSERDGVTRQWWKELWGINQCGSAAVYEVWFQEIGLGGVSFSSELMADPPADFVARMIAGKVLPADQVVARVDRPRVTKTGDNREADYLAIAKAAIAAKEVAGTIVATPAANSEAAPKAIETAPSGNGPFQPRQLAFKSPNFKGHDVCAIQRALIGEKISVGVDGLYGPGMKKGVAKFQKRRGLKPTGVFDDATRTALSFSPVDEAKKN